MTVKAKKAVREQCQNENDMVDRRFVAIIAERHEDRYRLLLQC
jgi:hypothetical protein